VILLLLAAIGAWLVGRRRIPPSWFGRMERLLEHGWFPLVVGVVTGLYYWWLWGSTFRATPLVSDESAYLFQASLFAAGRWVAPAPPLPEFFEQFHLLVTPVLAAKYPPGHSLMLVPGVLIGLPGLMPILLSAAAGGLVFLLARHTMNAGVGLMTWAIWLGCQGNLVWRPSYYSEVTTSTLGLFAWWAVLRWCDENGRAWLLLAAACIGWGAITRPLTMLVFALPLAVVVLKRVVRRRAWGDLASGVAVGTLVLGVFPLWSLATGDLRTTPLARYTAAYMPWDRLGFGVDTTPPLRTVPVEMQLAIDDFRGVHAEHTMGRVLPSLRERGEAFAAAAWSGWRSPLILFAIVGLLVLPEVALVAVATALLQFEAYAAYAHKPEWTLYYLELFPIAAFVTACGIVAVARLLFPHSPGAPASAAWRRLFFSGALGAVMLVLTLGETPAQRRWRLARPDGQLAQRAIKARIPDQRAVVFVRHTPTLWRHNFVTHSPFLDRERVWMVYDLGIRNAELVRAVPDRTAYVLDGDHLTRFIP
jgi:hypothetical protein